MSAAPSPTSSPSTRSGTTVFAKSPSTPQDQSIGVLAGLDELARRLGLPRSEMLRADAAHRAWHDGRDQRAARAQGRKGRAAHHRRPSRRAGDARGAEGQPLRPALAAAGAAGAAPAAPRRARAPARGRLGADAARRGLARRRHRDDQAVRRNVGRDLLPARLSQSRPRDRDRTAAAPRRCRTSSSRAPATCCRRSRNSSASRPRS